MSTVALLSGGLDSTTLLYWLVKAKRANVIALSFDYGQRHRKELGSSTEIARLLGVTHYIVDLRSVGDLIKDASSSLVNEAVEVPEGHYAADNMAATIVPNRNSIMLSIAYGVAIARRFNTVAFAAHAGDHEIYPDCRSDFAVEFDLTMKLANRPHRVNLYVPFIGSSKADIVTLGHAYGVPWQETWSCYKGGEKHCGRCGTCVERAEAFALAGVDDQTEYEDPDYWKTVTNI